MQILTKPEDGAWLLAQDVQALTGITCVADKPPRIPDASPLAWFDLLADAPDKPVTWEYDLSIDVWAGEGTAYSAAVSAAADVAAALAALDLDPDSQWRVSLVNSGYQNPDPAHAGHPRMTVTANAYRRGAVNDYIK